MIEGGPYTNAHDLMKDALRRIAEGNLSGDDAAIVAQVVLDIIAEKEKTWDTPNQLQ
jgi:hypothetical protein